MSEAKLPVGLYTIKSCLTGGWVGRYMVEDLSLLPKRILAYSEAMSHSVHPPRWVIKKHRDDPTKYRMEALGAPVAPFRGNVDAYLMPDMADSEGGIPKWQIKEYQVRGKTVYTISAAGRSEGWVARMPTGEDVDDLSPIQFKPLTTRDGNNDAETFEIVRLDHGH